MRRALGALIALAVLGSGTVDAGAKPAKPCATKKARKACTRLAAGVHATGRPVVFRVATRPAAPAVSAAAPGVTEPASVPTANALPASGAGAVAPGEPGVGAPVAEAPPVAPPAPARLQATAREFSLALSRPSVAAGALILQLVNRGEDPHDLHVRAGASDVLAIGLTDPEGGLGQATGTLTPGTYTLYCSLPGHEALGMRAALHVT